MTDDQVLDAYKTVTTELRNIAITHPGANPETVLKTAAIILGLGSTGRSQPLNLKEKLAMEQAQSDPAAGRQIPLTGGLKDSRWPGSAGWVKMKQTINEVEIHYNYNLNTGMTDDWKFK
jgi:filamentous hemagglutinin